jgi:hypothetical protein
MLAIDQILLVMIVGGECHARTRLQQNQLFDLQYMFGIWPRDFKAWPPSKCNQIGAFLPKEPWEKTLVYCRIIP